MFFQNMAELFETEYPELMSVIGLTILNNPQINGIHTDVYIAPMTHSYYYVDLTPYT